jgi:hypothetical protein
MKRTGIVLLLLALCAWGQETKPTIASTVDREISGIEKQVVEAAEAMPEEKFNTSRRRACTLRVPTTRVSARSPCR